MLMKPTAIGRLANWLPLDTHTHHAHTHRHTYTQTRPLATGQVLITPQSRVDVQAIKCAWPQNWPIPGAGPEIVFVVKCLFWSLLSMVLN